MPNYTGRIDEEPENWQFIASLRRDDLIAELIQNELDAGSTRTSLRFEKAMLICEGNGQPIQKDGWDRLSFFRGAGRRVDSKRRKTGVKNHGLKACFTIGNDIFIRSNGRYAHQTLFQPDEHGHPCPGVMDAPEADPSAPEVGCRIEVPYRTDGFKVPDGEGHRFDACTPAIISTLFTEAIAEIPLRFLGVVRPGIRKKYEIEISHWKLGTRIFRFSVSKANGHPNRTFYRTCTWQDSGKPRGERELVFVTTIPAEILQDREVPEFFERGKKSIAEISIAVDSKKRPVSKIGQLRYPIAYAGMGETSSTGVSASYSAPFFSDSARHGVSQAELNADIVTHCDEFLVKCIRDDLLPKFGPSVLSLVSSPTMPEDRREDFVNLLLKHRCIPLHRKGRRSKVRVLHQVDDESSDLAFVIPAYSFDQATISPELSQVCPSAYEQIHPDTPNTVVAELAEFVYDKEKQLGDDINLVFAVFDEDDFLGLCQAKDSDQGFAWSPDWEQDISSVSAARTILDIFNKVNGQITEDVRDEVKANLELPTQNGTREFLEQLYSSNTQGDLPAVIAPPALIHPDLRDHPLLKKPGWKLEQFGLDDLLDGVDFEKLEDSKHAEFWIWTRRNWKQFTPSQRRKAANLPIWPDASGYFMELSGLCYPRRREVREIMKSVIQLPATEVLKLKGIRMAGRGALSLRTQLSSGELRDWVRERQQRFREGEEPEGALKRDFRAYEKELLVLSRDASARKELIKLADQMIALSQAGFFRRLSDLHSPVPAIKALQLRPNDLIDRADERLNKILKPREQPSVKALTSAMAEPPSSAKVGWLRLEALKAACRPSGESPEVSNLPCVPVGDAWEMPSKLAIHKKGSKNYWGTWKKPLPSNSFSPSLGTFLEKIGVTPLFPTSSTSRSYFHWLRTQPEKILRYNLRSVVHQFSHPMGVKEWWKCYAGLTCLPVLRSGKVALVSFREATNANSRVLINDFSELGEILASVTQIALVVDIEGVKDSILEQLHDVPIKRLRLVAGSPISVDVAGETNKVGNPDSVLQDLKAPKLLRELPDRIRQYDVEQKHIRSDWRAQLAKIQSIRWCHDLHETYRVFGRAYKVQRNFAVEPRTGVLFIASSAADNVNIVLDAISHIAIVALGAPRFVAPAVHRALSDEYVSPAGLITPSQRKERQDVEEVPDERSEENAFRKRLHGRTNKLENVPRPRELPSEPDDTTGGPKSAPRKKVQKARIEHELEKEHREILKGTYAHHCQICLADATIDKLAPEGSYAFVAEHRRSFIQAHHVHAVAHNGRRDGGNLLVLCENHHHKYGDLIKRDQVSKKLRSGFRRSTIRFNDEAGTHLDGGTISIIEPELVEPVNLFFGNEHRKFWLQNAEES